MRKWHVISTLWRGEKATAPILSQREKRLSTSTAEISAPLSQSISTSPFRFNMPSLQDPWRLFDSHTCLLRFDDSLFCTRCLFFTKNVKVYVPLVACILVDSFRSAAIILRYEAGLRLLVPPQTNTELVLECDTDTADWCISE